MADADAVLSRLCSSLRRTGAFDVELMGAVLNAALVLLGVRAGARLEDPPPRFWAEVRRLADGAGMRVLSRWAGDSTEPILYNPARVPRSAVEAVEASGERTCGMPRILGYPVACGLPMTTLPGFVHFWATVLRLDTGALDHVWLAGMGCRAREERRAWLEVTRTWAAPAMRHLAGREVRICGRPVLIVSFAARRKLSGPP